MALFTLSLTLLCVIRLMQRTPKHALHQTSYLTQDFIFHVLGATDSIPGGRWGSFFVLLLSSHNDGP
jgi:hypothetical protein